MKVLWFTNNPCNYQKNSGGYNGGGWMTALQTEIQGCENIELGICFLLDGQPDKVLKDGVLYYPIPYRKKNTVEKISDILRYDNVSVERPQWDYYIQNFKNVINDYSPDIIHVFGSELYMGLVAFATNKPLVLHIQGILNTCYNSLYGAGISRRDYVYYDLNPLKIIQRYFKDLWWQRDCYREREVLKHIRHYIGRTEWDMRCSQVMSPDSVYHFGEEIMRSVFYDPPQRILPDILVVSTVISAPSYKGFDLVLKTANVLKNSLGLSFRWNVYGNIQPSFAEKETRIKTENVGVFLMGVVSADQLAEVHANSTVYVHSSYIENGCNAIIEAQMCGCTPIANYVGGLPTTIVDGETGYLVPANDPYQTAYLIKYLYEHPEENLEIGKKASIDAFERHNPEKIVSDLLQTYKEIINVG